MKAEEFSVCFRRWPAERRATPGSGRRLGESGWRAQRAGEAKTAAAGGARDKGAKRDRRPDALGTSGHERVANQGCPHCAGRAIVAWGRSHGLSRFRCKACGRTFNALTKTAMAPLHKRERWLDHARAMIEGKSLAKTAELCGVHPTTAFRWRHRFLGAPAADKPKKLSGIVEADETFILESFKGRWSDLPRKARKRGGPARHPGLHSDNIPVSSPATGGARPSTQSCRRMTAPRSERRWRAS